MRATEFIVEYSTEPREGPLEEFDGLRFKMTVYGFYNQINVSCYRPGSNEEIAHALFDILDYRQLEPLDLHVNEEDRKKGIAKTMYDYVKSKGYAIHRSWDQTEAGARFWNKHRGEDGQLWEQNIDEISNDTLQSYLGKADSQISRRLNRMSQARERLNKNYEIYDADLPGHPTVERFQADTPEQAREYYYDYIKNYVSDRDYTLELRRGTGLLEGSEINELFQPGKKNWKWKFRGSEEAMAQFTAGDRDYMWSAYNHFLDGKPNKWEIQFRLLRKDIDPESLDLFGTTGTGNSAEVLSTATDITREFLEQYIDNIDEITFSAKENSRIALYRKMIKRLLPDWEVEEDYTTDDGLKFSLFKPKEI